MSQMRVSIVLATYNGACYLQEQLQSYITQKHRPHEVVICDDNSEDRTVSILQEFAKSAPFDVRIFESKSRLGLTKNFERALTLASGDILFLSDQDDLWLPSKLQNVLAYFADHPEADVVINDAYYGDEALNITGDTVLGRVLKVGAPPRSHIAGACTAITANFRDFIIPFPEKGLPQYDVYLHRWANIFATKHIIQLPLQIWRIHGSNASHSNELSRLVIKSAWGRYREFKNSFSYHSYTKVVEELLVMKQLLQERQHLLPNAASASVGICRRELESIIEAYKLRAELAGKSRFKRIGLIYTLLMRGHYRRFKGIYSLAKDLLR